MIRSLAAAGLIAACLASPLAAELPAALAGDHRALRRTISYAEMEAFLEQVARPGFIEVRREGTSTQGRGVFLVHVAHGLADRAGAGPEPWRVLLYAQQHGNEVSGKDALLFLLRDLSREPARLPRGVDLWVMPMVNPDGAEANQRRNGAGIDLNRDHVVLSQPETQALHRVARRVRPHVAVDGHEYTRDGEEWRRRGLLRWPIIMMDGANHPLFDPALVAAGLRWVDEGEAALAAAGHAYERYSVGGPPPDQEQRHSTVDTDDGRNGLAAHGALSFIIEAGVKRAAPDPQADLGDRVDAYLALFRRFLEADPARRQSDTRVVEAARARPLPEFLPTHAFWANVGLRRTLAKAIDAATGRAVLVPTANFMSSVVVKATAATPRAYAVAHPAAVPAFRALLERHGLAHETLAAADPVDAERCTLLRIEEEEDLLYARHEGRQVVRCASAARTELPAGSLQVRLDGPDAARAALLLEPSNLYGLYRYPEFRPLVAADGALPVLRVVGPAPAGSAARGY